MPDLRTLQSKNRRSISARCLPPAQPIALAWLRRWA
jgi:hypothetical protein